MRSSLVIVVMPLESIILHSGHKLLDFLLFERPKSPTVLQFAPVRYSGRGEWTHNKTRVCVRSVCRRGHAWCFFSARFLSVPVVRPALARDVKPILIWSWPIVCDAGPSSRQHSFLSVRPAVRNCFFTNHWPCPDHVYQPAVKTKTKSQRLGQ